MPHFDFLCRIPVIRPKPKLLNCTRIESYLELRTQNGVLCDSYVTIKACLRGQ